jgi:hydroxymethylpyrimidine/phosphomethylpyrimidine kinase
MDALVAAAAPVRRIVVCGGVDPSGGAGLSLDAAVVAAHGAMPLPVVLALTEQDRTGFRRLHPTPVAQWRAALAAALADGPVDAVKVGLVGDADTARALGDALAALPAFVPVLVDPVLGATAGGMAAGAALVAAYRSHLVPRAALLTPNLPELRQLFDGSLAAALAAGARAVLCKGGHGEGSTCNDVLATADGGQQTYRRARLPCGPVRGTGCALAAAIAARLARGSSLGEACGTAGHWLAGLLRALGPAAADALPRPLPWDRLSAPA